MSRAHHDYYSASEGPPDCVSERMKPEAEDGGRPSHLQQLHQRHAQDLRMPGRHRGRGGGVLPISVDLDSSAALALLAEDRAGHICSAFGGWFDDGETPAQGAAREFYEESRGVICSLLDAWRCTSLVPEYSKLLPSTQPNRFMFVMMLAPTTAVDREALLRRFADSPGWDGASREMSRLHFVPLALLRDHCVRQAVGAPLVGVADHELHVRRFLHEWMANAKLWERVAWLKGLLDIPAVACCLAVTDLPQLSETDEKELSLISTVGAKKEKNSEVGLKVRAE
jgi:hypothetical protein